MEDARIDLLIRELAARERKRNSSDVAKMATRENYSKVVLNKRMFISVVESTTESMIGNGAIKRFCLILTSFWYQGQVT
jgi:hypothetical protein